jgi:hypothetical protein
MMRYVVALALIVAMPAQALAVFPTTSVLDDFNRANENPLSTAGNWGGAVFAGGGEFKIVSNALQDDSAADGAGASNQFWDGATYGPGAEVFIDLPTIWQAAGSDGFLSCNTANEGSAFDGYVFYFVWNAGSTFDFCFFRYDDESGTILDCGTVTLVNGDSVGLECAADGTLTAYRKNAGTWTALSPTASDTTYTSGHIGVSKGVNDTTSVLDNFGGGTIGLASVTSSWRTLAGVGQ